MYMRKALRVARRELHDAMWAWAWAVRDDTDTPTDGQVVYRLARARAAVDALTRTGARHVASA